jgi:WD40 repeat protein
LLGGVIKGEGSVFGMLGRNFPDIRTLLASLHDTRTGKTQTWLRWYRLQGGPVFSPCSRFLGWVSADDSVHVADANSGRELKAFGRLAKDGDWQWPNPVVQFSPDSERIAALTVDRAAKPSKILARVWHWRTGRLLGRWLIPLPFDELVPAAGLAFIGDGRTLATAVEGEHDIRLWEVATGRERGRLKSQHAPVSSLALSPDAQWLASGCDNGSILIWDVGQLSTSAPAAK